MGPQTLTSLGNETMIWFGDNNYDEWNEGFFTLYKEPPYKLPGHTGAYSFGLAGRSIVFISFKCELTDSFSL